MITVEEVVELVGNSYTVRQMENGGQKQVFQIKNGSQNFVLKFVQVEEYDEDEPGIKLPRSAEEERTYREIRLMASVDSAHLPKLGPIDPFEHISEGLKHVAFTEEYIGDRSAKDLIRDGYFDSPAKIRSLALDVSKALVVYNGFEDGFVHRDVKPGNIVKRNGADQFVLIDGGVHLLPSNPTITSSSAFIGTRKYASPEQLTQGRRHIDARSDIFSLGVVLYEAATGGHPFYRRGVGYDVGLDRHIRADYDPIIGAHPMNIFQPAIARMLTRYPHTRYPSLEDLVLDVQGVSL